MERRIELTICDVQFISEPIEKCSMCDAFGRIEVINISGYYPFCTCEFGIFKKKQNSMSLDRRI